MVYAEFFEQGDAQRELGTNVEPLLDRNKVWSVILHYDCLPHNPFIIG